MVGKKGTYTQRGQKEGKVQLKRYVSRTRGGGASIVVEKKKFRPKRGGKKRRPVPQPTRRPVKTIH